MRESTLGRCVVRAGTIVLLASLVGRGYAHHSGAMYDLNQSITLSGTVRTFQWTNPHCWLQLVVAGKDQPVEWSVEMGSPGQLFRLGWRPGTVKPGEVVSVVVHPVRNGTPAGKYVSATHADGTPLVTSATAVSAGSAP